MWDNRRKVGVLNDFDLARFADQTGASGQDNTGTLPYMGLDLLSEKGLRGEIPRRYRHEAESFAWSLIYLYFATVEGSGGNNLTPVPHPLREWFEDWKTSLRFKIVLEWRDHDTAGVRLVHPNTRELARALHEYWVDRYNRQLPPVFSKETVDPSPLEQELGRTFADSTEDPPPEEKDDDTVFGDLVYLYSRAFGSKPLMEIRDMLVKMHRNYKKVVWSD